MIGDEFKKLFSISKILTKFTSDRSQNFFNSVELFNFVKVNSIIKTSNRKALKNEGIKLGNFEFIRNPEISDIIYEYYRSKLNDLKSFKKININNIIYSIKKEKEGN